MSLLPTGRPRVNFGVDPWFVFSDGEDISWSLSGFFESESCLPRGDSETLFCFSFASALLFFSGCVGDVLQTFEACNFSILTVILPLGERSSFWAIAWLFLSPKEFSLSAFSLTEPFDALSSRLPWQFPGWARSSFLSFDSSFPSPPFAAVARSLSSPCWLEPVFTGFTIINWVFCLDTSSLELTVCTGTKILPWMRYICPVVVLATMTCWLFWEDLPLAIMVALMGVACCWVVRAVAVGCCIVWIPSVLFSTTGALPLSDFSRVLPRRSSSSDDRRSSHLKEGTAGLPSFFWTFTACSPSMLLDSSSSLAWPLPSQASVLLLASSFSANAFSLLADSLHFSGSSVSMVVVLFALSSRSLSLSLPSIFIISVLATTEPQVPRLGSSPVLSNFPVSPPAWTTPAWTTVSSPNWLMVPSSETFFSDLLSNLSNVSAAWPVSQSALLVLSLALSVSLQVVTVPAPVWSSNSAFFSRLVASLSLLTFWCSTLLLNSPSLQWAFLELETSLPSLDVSLTISVASLDSTSSFSLESTFSLGEALVLSGSLIATLILLPDSPVSDVMSSPCSLRSSLKFAVSSEDSEVVSSPASLSGFVLFTSLRLCSSPTLPQESSLLTDEFGTLVSSWPPCRPEVSVFLILFDPFCSLDFVSAFSALSNPSTLLIASFLSLGFSSALLLSPSVPSFLVVGGNTDGRSASDALLLWRGTPFWPSPTFFEAAFCLNEHCTALDTVPVASEIPSLRSLLGGEEDFIFFATGFLIEPFSSKPSWPALVGSGLLGFGEGTLDGGDLLRGGEGIFIVLCCPGYDARRWVRPAVLVPLISCCDW